MPIEQCGAVRKCMASPQSYKSQMPRGYTYREPSSKSVAAFALQALERAWEQDKATHKKNTAALEANRAVRERVQSVMDEVGMPKTRKVQSGTRYGLPKYKSVDAGYLDDLRSAVPVDDGFGLAQQAYERLKPAYDKFAEEAEKEAETARLAAERAAEAEKQQRRDNIEMAKIILRYELPEDSSWGDILGELRKKDQRLDLAVAMSQTRGDWSDGFWRVSDAIGRFKIENDDDKNIANEILSLLKDDHDDGRVFRDCEWSYSRLFSEARDSQLSADIQMAMSKSQGDY